MSEKVVKLIHHSVNKQKSLLNLAFNHGSLRDHIYHNSIVLSKVVTKCTSYLKEKKNDSILNDMHLIVKQN